MSRRRTARIETPHPRAHALAAAVRPDNTDDIDTQADDGVVVTEISRETTTSLATTVDDYVRNLRVATRLLSGPDDLAQNSTANPTTPDTTDATDTPKTTDTTNP